MSTSGDDLSQSLTEAFAHAKVEALDLFHKHATSRNPTASQSPCPSVISVISAGGCLISDTIDSTDTSALRPFDIATTAQISETNAMSKKNACQVAAGIANFALNSAVVRARTSVTKRADGVYHFRLASRRSIAL